MNLENTSWLIGGVINHILHYSEHSSPSRDHLTPDMIGLNDVFATLGIEDLRFHGSFHTWTNKRPEGPITEKLDRALVNAHWNYVFPYSMATFSAHRFFDHSPYVVQLSSPCRLLLPSLISFSTI